MEEFDNFWHSQNSEENIYRNQFENRNDSSSDDLSSSGFSRNQRFEQEDSFAGAYEGIMSIRDDPKKAGQRQFCG